VPDLIATACRNAEILNELCHGRLPNEPPMPAVTPHELVAVTEHGSCYGEHGPITIFDIGFEL